MLRSSAALTSASTMVRVFIAMVSMATMAHSKYIASTSASPMVRDCIAMVSMAAMAHSKYSLDFSEHDGFTHRKE